MAALIRGWLVADMFAGSACDWATCADRMAALCHGDGIVANHLPTATSKGARGRRTPAVAMTTCARRCLVTHILAGRTCHRAACASGMAAVRHGVRIMANHLPSATSNWARGRRTPAVALTTCAGRWLVAHVVPSRACDRAACAHGVAGVHHRVGVPARNLVAAACHRAWTR